VLGLFTQVTHLGLILAVIYVLTDKFKYVSKQEKRRMLNEGALAANSERS